MKYLLLLSLLFVSPKVEVEVYICTGPASACYHKSEKCRAFNNCSGSVKKVTLDEAVNKYKRRACGWCYKKKGG